MRKNRKKSRLIMTCFALHSHPRFKGGSYSNFIGWSKPRIEVYEVKTIRQNEQACFAGQQVKIIDIKHGYARLNFTELKTPHENETREYVINKPVSVGYNPDLYDASCEYFIGCWTSRVLWNNYCLRTVLARQYEINISRLQRVPSYFTKRALKFYLNHCKCIVEDFCGHFHKRL